MRTRFSLSQVPYLPQQRIERAAADLLMTCGKQAAKSAVPPVNVEFIVEGVLELGFGVEDLSHLGPDVLGATWFDERMVRVATTVEQQEGRYCFTLAHEVGHWQLHRPQYESAKKEMPLFPPPPGEKPPPAVVCRRSLAKANAEWQADRFAAALLMPQTDVHAAARVVLKGKTTVPVKGLGDENGYSLPEVKKLATAIKDAGNFSNVSNEAMRRRLLDLKIVVDAASYTPELF